MPKGFYKRSEAQIAVLVRRNKSRRQRILASLANKGKVVLESTKEKLRQAQEKYRYQKHLKFLGRNNPRWKGDTVGYRALHTWVNTHYGKANRCTNPDCKGISRVFEWANISGEYKRDISDWKMLCKSCHGIFDRGLRLCKKLS